jgi:regulator of sigma E protease
MDFILNGLATIVPFILIISIIVFVHEWGHYIVAKRCGVRIETFSIGFGREIFGWTDKSGTRWKIAWLPLGGYVKMFGDADPSSSPDAAKLEAMDDTARSQAFYYKNLKQKAAIVAAGPGINYLFAILIFIGFFWLVGYPQTLPVVGEVVKNSAAERAGLQPGDRITHLNGEEIEYFTDMQRIVSIRPGEPMQVELIRNGKPIAQSITAERHESTDMFGNKTVVGRLGIGTSEMVYEPLPFAKAVTTSFREAYHMSAGTLTAIGQMITGKRGTEDLGGVLRIAKYSGQSAHQGWASVIWFMALLSINLGLINLFPIPVLDGGHLLYYAVEGIRGKPMHMRMQELGFKVGFVLIVSLMLFTTVNDVMHLWFK